MTEKWLPQGFPLDQTNLLVYHNQKQERFVLLVSEEETKRHLHWTSPQKGHLCSVNTTVLAVITEGLFLSEPSVRWDSSLWQHLWHRRWGFTRIISPSSGCTRRGKWSEAAVCWRTLQGRTSPVERSEIRRVDTVNVAKFRAWRTDPVCFVFYLSQHIVLLHVVNLPGVDLPFEGVLEELATDIKQQGADRSFLQRAARGGLVVVAGGWDAVTQDHTYQQTCG